MRSLKQLAYVGTAFAFGLALVGCGFPMSNVDQKPTSLAQEEQTSSQIEGKSSDDTTTIKDGEDATKDDTLIGGKEASDAKKGETEQDDTKESKRESLPVHKGSLAVGVEEDGSPVVAEETMRSLICITLQEESFELPIAMEDLLARGWEVESFADEGTLIEPVQGLKSIPLHVKGDPRSKIEVRRIAWDFACVEKTRCGCRVLRGLEQTLPLTTCVNYLALVTMRGEAARKGVPISRYTSVRGTSILPRARFRMWGRMARMV